MAVAGGVKVAVAVAGHQKREMGAGWQRGEGGGRREGRGLMIGGWWRW